MPAWPPFAVELFARAVRRYQAGQISFAQVRPYNLDASNGPAPRPLRRGLHEASTAPRRPRNMPRGAPTAPTAGAMTSRCRRHDESHQGWLYRHPSSASKRRPPSASTMSSAALSPRAPTGVLTEQTAVHASSMATSGTRSPRTVQGLGTIMDSRARHLHAMR